MKQIKLPILFSRSEQETLNNALLSKTGCFLFLKTDEILPGFAPASYADAFIGIVVGLYIIYHDLACSYWKALLSTDICPPGVFEKGRLNKPKKHIESIILSLRPQISHGFLIPRDPQADEFRDILEFLYSRDKTKLLPWGSAKMPWPRYMQMMEEDNWKTIVESIIKDSNDFYSLMFEWADSWEKAVAGGAVNPRHDFIWSDAFANSIDLRVLKPLSKKRRLKELTKEELPELQNHIRYFYEKNTNKKPDRILKEINNWLTYRSEGRSSLDIAADFGFALKNK